MAELCIVMFLVVGDILAVQCTAQPEERRLGRWGRHRDAATGRRGDRDTRRHGEAETGRCGDGERRRWGDAEMGRCGDAARAKERDR